MSGALLSPIRFVPDGWRELGSIDIGVPARAFTRRSDGLRVLASLEKHEDGLRWAHVSCSFPDRLPSWDDLKAVKEAFLGDVLAFQVLPPKAEYVNQHNWTLHLWHCRDRDPFPAVPR